MEKNALQLQGEEMEKLLHDMGISCDFTGFYENILSARFDFNLNSLKQFTRLPKIVEILNSCLHKTIDLVESKTAHFALQIKKEIDKIDYLDYKDLDVEDNLTALIGLDHDTQPVYFNIPKTIHTLIGGATGMGKTSLINNIIYSLSKKNTKETLQFALIDTKRTLGIWSGLPNLYKKPALDDYEAEKLLNEIIRLMRERINILEKKKMTKATPDMFPYIVVVIDELADLMLTYSKDSIEEKLTRIAQLGRAVNISLILATQNPIAKVCTSNIKANCPTVIALKTVSIVTSRVILDNKKAFMLDGVGNAIIRPADNPKERSFKVFYLPEEEIRNNKGEK